MFAHKERASRRELYNLDIDVAPLQWSSEDTETMKAQLSIWKKMNIRKGGMPHARSPCKCNTIVRKYLCNIQTHSVSSKAFGIGHK